MERYYYSDSISSFLKKNSNEILGLLSRSNEFSLESSQRYAWLEEIRILKNSINGFEGYIYFEYSIPRMGKRIDVVLIIGSIIFVIEFKVGEKEFNSSAIDQVWDYSLDLKNFHEASHNHLIAPILVATCANSEKVHLNATPSPDKVLTPIRCNTQFLHEVIKNVLLLCDEVPINVTEWENGSYKPTPTIIEAAMALYNGHSVKEISRSDAGAKNLRETSDEISKIIRYSQESKQKSICFITGVPGSGKTLVGLNIATQHIDKSNEMYSVFLSGNGPLVSVLREALARDKVQSEKDKGNQLRLNEARRDVKLFIQNVHNFRDECLVELVKPPLEHVALFDEAQRAWDIQQTANFMKRKKNFPGFDQSEPEFLISCLDRHKDWAVIVCLVGGGQEINTGEAGIKEWFYALNKSFPKWKIYISSHLSESEYGASKILEEISPNSKIYFKDDLHLSVSLRSFRSENVSLLVKHLLDINREGARSVLREINNKYPIVITRNLSKAKHWLNENARGSERYGLVVSSQALRLKPLAIDVRASIDPIHWFLDEKDDIRSSYYLEDVATEFQIQGLELDWTCVVWDGDFQFNNTSWSYSSFGPEESWVEL